MSKVIKNKILILGATGFIGRNILEFYSNKLEYEVHATYNKRPNFNITNAIWHKTNLTNQLEVEDLIKEIKPKKIVQAAATTSGAKDIVQKPYLHVTDNAVMNSFIFRAAIENNVEHVVFFSCTVMYQSSIKPIKETDFDANKNVYEKYFGVAHTKLYLEKMCEFFSSISDTKFTAIRHSNIYGPYDKYDYEKSHFFGANVSKVMTSSDTITLWGTGEEKRDILHVNDLMNFVEAAFHNQESSFKVYNCGYGEAYSVKSIVEMIIEASGKNIKIKNDLTKPTINTSLCLDCSLAKKELHWVPQYEIKLGIKSTVDWWEENINPRTLELLR